ncbi:hypothetical protein Pfo_011554 [Paulownia fortunei]|nr:hypothetical protein Pfo_011554 [Paulownia fortunei]
MILVLQGRIRIRERVSIRVEATTKAKVIVQRLSIRVSRYKDSHNSRAGKRAQTDSSLCEVSKSDAEVENIIKQLEERETFLIEMHQVVLSGLALTRIEEHLAHHSMEDADLEELIIHEDVKPEEYEFTYLLKEGIEKGVKPTDGNDDVASSFSSDVDSAQLS